MSKQDFLNSLRASLGNELGASAAEEHVRYYEEYISSQVRMGKSEEQVLRELGNPKLIARSILDAGGKTAGRETYGGEQGSGTYGGEGNTGGYFGSKKSGIRIQNRNVPLWLIITIIVVLVCVIFGVVVMVVWWLAPVIVVIWLIGFAIKLLRGRR